MKFNLFLITLLAGMLAWTQPMAQAETEADSTAQVSKKAKKSKKGKKAKKEEATEESKVAAILKENQFFNNTEPNLNAEYFIFLKSASWCGPCNMEMPSVVDAYELMKASGRVELILVSYDRTEEDAKKWFEKFKATYPAVMKRGKLPALPPEKGIPNATIMKADGTVIESGHGSIIRGWKKQTIGEFAALGDDGEPRVGKAMKKMKFTNGKPSAKAKFYIYLYAPTPEGIDSATLSSLAEEYKDMKKQKVEVIFISEADSPAKLAKHLKTSKAKFPAIQKDAEGVLDLPGLGGMGSEPYAWVVTQSGASISSGAPSIISNWQKFVDANK